MLQSATHRRDASRAPVLSGALWADRIVVILALPNRNDLWEPMRRPAGRNVVKNLYEMMSLARHPLEDLTEGMYEGDATRPYQEAQDRQREYLLDEVACGRETRLLDVGCGNGTLLDDAGQRGAAGVGITLSPSQAAYCRSKGLDARVLDYRDLPGGLRPVRCDCHQRLH